MSADVRDLLHRTWGAPRSLPPDLRDDDGLPVVVAYAVSSQEAARAYVEGEMECYGNPAHAQLREAVGWCVSVDMRPQIARARAEMGGDS